MTDAITKCSYLPTLNSNRCIGKRLTVFINHDAINHSGLNLQSEKGQDHNQNTQYFNLHSNVKSYFSDTFIYEKL